MPRLAEGIELIGEYEGSGLKETPYLARRSDGQVLQLTRLPYLIVQEVDGQRNFDHIAERVSEKFGRSVSAENVKFLVEKKLRPIGVLASADGTSLKLKKARPMLALNLRLGLIPEGLVRVITTIFYPLFYLPVVLAVLGALVALDVWLFFIHGVAQSVRDITYQPLLFLLVLVLLVLSAAFHECGHATACRFGGASPGVIGVGVYLVYPAFFNDVTDVYRLDRLGRIRTDLGGIYFNTIFSLWTAGAYFVTSFEPLLVIIVIQHLEMLHQLLPFLRLDGYFVISDLTGVPDLFTRIRPILQSLIPGRTPDASVTSLKPWVRVVVTAWVLTVIPILMYLVVAAVMIAPRLLATAYDSFFFYYDQATSAFQEDKAAEVAADSIQIIFLILPLAGLAFTFGRVGKRLALAMWIKSEGKPALRAAFAGITLVTVVLVAFNWGPHGDYEPIQSGERGTIQDSLLAFRDVSTRGLAPTPERKVELNDAPVLQQRPALRNDTKVSESDETSEESVSDRITSDTFAEELQPGDETPNLQQPVGVHQYTQGKQKQTVQESTTQNEGSIAPGRLRSAERTVIESVAEGTQAAERR